MRFEKLHKLALFFSVISIFVTFSTSTSFADTNRFNPNDTVRVIEDLNSAAKWGSNSNETDQAPRIVSSVRVRKNPSNVITAGVTETCYATEGNIVVYLQSCSGEYAHGQNYIFHKDVESYGGYAATSAE